MHDLVRMNVTDGIAVITFDNPPRGYMNAPQVTAADAIVDAISARGDVRAVVFTGGVPGVFVRHYDVGELVSIAQRLAGTPEADLRAAGEAGNAVSVLFDKVAALPMPTIAAINGFCQGGGFEFALCCDVRIAQAGDYRIGLPEVNLGIFPGAGGTARLLRLVGEARALELVLRGRTVAPVEAASLGLVHEVADDAVASALATARAMVAKPARGLADAKALVRLAAEVPMADALAEARGRFLALIATDAEALTTMQRFLVTGEDINA
jgi:enoyl-CoA hydratase